VFCWFCIWNAQAESTEAADVLFVDAFTDRVSEIKLEKTSAATIKSSFAYLRQLATLPEAEDVAESNFANISENPRGQVNNVCYLYWDLILRGHFRIPRKGYSV